MVDTDVIGQQQLDLGRVLELADLMLQAAEQAQWETVMELQENRDRLIRQFFAEDIAIDRSQLAEAINHIIEKDKLIEKLGNDERASLQAQILTLTQGKSAVKAYTTK